MRSSSLALVVASWSFSLSPTPVHAQQEETPTPVHAQQEETPPPDDMVEVTEPAPEEERPPLPTVSPDTGASPDLGDETRPPASDAGDVRTEVAPPPDVETTVSTETSLLPAWLLDGLRVIRPTLLGEIDGRLYAREPEGESGFALARFRFGLVFEPTEWLRAVATAEWVGEHAALLDGYVVLRPFEWLEVGVGYAKTPLFPSFRLEPVHTLPFPDRAPVVTAFRVQRDAGAEVRIAPREAPVEAIVRVGNGSGSILGNDTPIPAGYASADLVLGRAWSGASASDRGWGLRLGAAGMIESVRDRNGVAGTAPLGFVYYRPTIVSGERLVGEAHAITYLDTVRLTFEGALAQESRSRDDDGNPSTPRVALDPIRSSGLTAELAWVALGGARAPGFAPTLAPGSSGAWAGGALEVAVRFDALWLGWGAADVTEGGALAGGASVRWWPVDFVTVTLAGHVTRYATPPIETPQEIWSWDALLRLGVFWGLGAVNG